MTCVAEGLDINPEPPTRLASKTADVPHVFANESLPQPLLHRDLACRQDREAAMRRAEGLEPLSEAAAAELGDLAERVVVTTRILRDFDKAWGFGRFAWRRRAADQPWWRRACAACCPAPTETPEEMLDRIVRFKVRRRRFCACGKTVFGSCLPPPLLSPFLRVGANHRSSSLPPPLRGAARRQAGVRVGRRALAAEQDDAGDAADRARAVRARKRFTITYIPQFESLTQTYHPTSLFALSWNEPSHRPEGLNSPLKDGGN